MHTAVPSPCTGGATKMVMGLQDWDSGQGYPMRKAWCSLDFGCVGPSELWGFLKKPDPTCSFWKFCLAAHQWAPWQEAVEGMLWLMEQHTDNFAPSTSPDPIFVPALMCCFHQGASCGTHHTNNTRGFFPWGYFWQVLLLWQQIARSILAECQLKDGFWVFLSLLFFFTTKKNEAVGVDLWQFYWNI